MDCAFIAGGIAAGAFLLLVAGVMLWGAYKTRGKVDDER